MATRGRSGSSPATILAAVVLAALTASGCCLSDCGPAPTPFQSTLTFPLTLSVGTPVHVRHVTWSVVPGRAPAGSLELLAVVGSPRDDAQDPCAIRPGSVRILPDDHDLVVPVFVPPGACTLPSLDLAEVCASGCSGGATVIVSSDRFGDQPDQSVSLLVALRGSTSMGVETAAPGRGWTLQLQDAPIAGQEHAQRVTSGSVEGPMDVFDQSPVVRHVVFTVAAEALQAPFDRLHGTMRIGIRQVDGGSTLGGVQRITVGTLEPFGQELRTFNTEVDWLRLCQPGVNCEIPITFEVTTPSPVPSGDPLDWAFYRWYIEAGLDSLDGRSLAGAPFTITER